MVYNNIRSSEMNQLFCLIKNHFMDPQVATKYTSRYQPHSRKTSFLINNLYICFKAHPFFYFYSIFVIITKDWTFYRGMLYLKKENNSQSLMVLGSNVYNSYTS